MAEQGQTLLQLMLIRKILWRYLLRVCYISNWSYGFGAEMTGWGSLARDMQEARLDDNNDIIVLPSDLKVYESVDCRSNLFCNSLYWI